MKTRATKFIAGAAAFIFLSCGRHTEKKGEPLNFSLKITDSVQINFLGELILMDYDSQQDKYLLSTEDQYEYLEVNASGEILNHHKLEPDGIDAVASVVGLGYLDGDVTVLSGTKGYLSFRDSKIIGQITIPYDLQPFMSYPKLGIFNYKAKTYYPKPWPASSKIVIGGGAFYKELYKSPKIEGQNLATGDTINTVFLPETSDLLDGQIHGMPFPVYTQTDDRLLLSTWIEPKIYLYKSRNDGFKYHKTVKINIPGWIAYTPSSSDDPGQFYQHNNNRINGSLVNLLRSEQYYVAVYNKGIAEDKMPEIGDDRNAYGVALQKLNPFYAAIFDHDFNQLGTDVPFPTSSNRPMVVNKEGEFVVSKVAGLSDTEDEGVILYKLRLTHD